MSRRSPPAILKCLLLGLESYFRICLSRKMSILGFYFILHISYYILHFYHIGHVVRKGSVHSKVEAVIVVL